MTMGKIWSGAGIVFVLAAVGACGDAFSGGGGVASGDQDAGVGNGDGGNPTDASDLDVPVLHYEGGQQDAPNDVHVSLDGCTGLVCNNACVPNDVNNCGSCGHACSTVANAHATCSGSTCGFACDAGFQMCGTTRCVLSADPNVGIFVAPGGANTACGSIGAPCGTIQTGINVAAQAGKKLVFVAEGTYSEDVSLKPGISLYGGWVYSGGGQWAPDCSANGAKLTILNAAVSTTALVANGVGAVTVDTLTVNTIASAGAGQSLYGIFVQGSTQLTLNNVNVSAVRAGDGAGVGTGQGGAPVSACSNTAARGNTGGGAVTPAAPGTPGATGSTAAGAFSSTGWITGNGGQGTTGKTVGADGYSGYGDCGALDGTCDGNCNYVGGPTTCGPDSSKSNPTNCKCAVDGIPGCGGNPGGGGPGGLGGGSSVAVYVWSAATLTINAGSLSSGDGGNGSAGGAGGGGSSGTLGSDGANAVYAGDCQLKCTQNPPDCVCGAKSIPLIGGKATAYQGGVGGAGGQGGGGAGGSSYSYVAGGGASVTVNGSTLKNGSAGSGAGGAPAGGSGPHYP
jgi:hypothetical protein